MIKALRTTALAVLLVGCASSERAPEERPLTAAEGRARVSRLLPPSMSDRGGWATDLYAAFSALRIAPTHGNLCAAIAVVEQESSFRADPGVPGLSAIAWKEIDRQAERAGVPRLVVRAALYLSSPDGRSYSDRLDTVKTEKQLSEIFEDFIAMVPLGKTFFADRNPIRTGGPMQVSIAYAEAHAADKSYPYPVKDSIRGEVFSRRGGLYFGIAHLLDYPASYGSHIYRYADFNAGHYASRNAAFQSAVTQLTGIPLSLDGDLLRYEKGKAAAEPGETELATRVLGSRLDMSASQIRRDLEKSRTREFEETRLFERVFAAADRSTGRKAPRAVLPQILLQSPKITRKLTTEWFAQRVDARWKTCMGRAEPAGASLRMEEASS